MADESQQRTVNAAFAPPPPLWKHFTPENIDRVEQIKAEASRGEDGRLNKNKKWSPAELRALEIPSELRYLVPPDIPEGQYSVFGELQTLSTALPSLQEQGIEQLYPEPPAAGTDQNLQPSPPLNHAYYLLKISKSLLLNFLEFTGILSVSPEQFESKVEDLRNLFINAHHLLNLYRPHQARESLIMMMEEQLNHSREEMKQMDKVKVEVESLLEQLQAEGSRVAAAGSGDDTDQAKALKEKADQHSQLIWDLLDKEN
ncbi:Mediator complex subunit Med7 [Penicillium cf. griseofulvum]|uniref:Mediator of RNA polymerase II transcription subunit 7 n=1 Tax=Penicillium cf. griseofulvum TaxID=2972120 RepID=A0A9W9T0S3_9EURO|nr:Mediator complex subunit Med7 [Penicillium cf. griseofulvum]KAJ5437684.1 Mediator complex subunit Med7 [Penicillium cf. griseofulvum]